MIGAILVAYKQLIVSKRLGVSQTAIEIINGRWTMHIFGLREDPGASKLTPALPNTSTVGLRYVSSILKQLAFGFDMTGDYEASLEKFVASEDLIVADTYFMGHKTKKGTWMVVAELKLN